MLTKLSTLSREIVPVQVSGNVSIDPSAVIAPGVLLQAEGNDRIKIGAGVCIGAGTIVHAAGGNLYIEAGVCLGRGVLIIGRGEIDRDACIGAGTTAIDPQIEAGTVIPPHSLLGDRSRGETSVVEDPDLPDRQISSPSPDTETSDVWDSPTALYEPAARNFFKVKTPETTDRSANKVNQVNQIDEQPISSPSADIDPHPPPTVTIEYKSTNFVAGRAQFDRMKNALFLNLGNNDDTASI
jgi:carbon dioxide concentrating mechanism protein CcmN